MFKNQNSSSKTAQKVMLLGLSILWCAHGSGALGATTKNKNLSLSPFVALAAKSTKIKNFHLEHVPNEFIVKFAENISTRNSEELLDAAGLKPVHRYRSSGAYLVRALDQSQALSALEMLVNDPQVNYVESNTIIRLNTHINFQSLPNDVQFGELWGLHNIGQNSGVDNADIDAPEAWDITKGSRAIVTAVIDTGIDYKHPDLAANYWKNPGETGLDAKGKLKETNGIDDDNNGYIDDFRGWDFVSNDNDPMDDHGHGSHCAGTIAAVGQNSLGVTGVNWIGSVVGLKFLDAAGSGSLDQAIMAIEYATSLGVNIMSNSWGGGGYSETLFQAISAASKKEILFVAAAGNDGTNNDVSPAYPASYPIANVISVAAMDRRDLLAKFSNYGAGSVHVSAPGVDILSTVLNQKYARMSGTSMATPHVSGVAALVKSYFPEESMEKLKNRLLFSSKPSPQMTTKTISGGRINAFNALKKDETPPAQVQNILVTKKGVNSVEIAFSPVGDDGMEGQARSYEIIYSFAPSQGEPLDMIHLSEKRQIFFVSSTPETSQEMTKLVLKNLPFESRGFIKVRAFDSVGNASEPSESVFFELPKLMTFYTNEAQSLTSVTLDAPWGLEKTSAESPTRFNFKFGADGSSFSDSPGKPYQNNAKTSLTLKKIALPSHDVTFLKVLANTDLESNFDFVHFEISFNSGATWRKIASITGNAPWTTYTVELPLIPAEAKEIDVRFTLESDASVTYGGIQIDEVSLFTRAPDTTF